jgi:hypothetical protein
MSKKDFAESGFPDSNFMPMGYTLNKNIFSPVEFLAILSFIYVCVS